MISLKQLTILTALLAMTSNALVSRINQASVDVCLEGWLRGEAAIIGAHADQKNFFFQWLETGQKYPFSEFPAFFKQFKGDALERTGYYNVTFFNFIQWEEGSRMYQAGQWIVDGYDSGDYTLMVEDGLLKWGRTQKIPNVLAGFTFLKKELCNKPDGVCRTNVVKA